MRNFSSTTPAVKNFTATRTVITACKKMVLKWKNAMSIFLLMAFLFSANNSTAQSFGKDFKQAANHDTTLGTLHWINSILQSSNSVYVEGMSTPQRFIMTDLADCNTGHKHQLRIKLQADKGGHHAYDFLTSWGQTFAATNAIAPGAGIMPLSRAATGQVNECGNNIAAGAQVACNLVTAGGNVVDLPISGELNNPLNGDLNNISTIISTYETRYGQRTVRMYSDSAFIGTLGVDLKVEFVQYQAGYIFYDIFWQSTGHNFVLEFGAHIAQGIDGLCAGTGCGTGWGPAMGASSINGGPYHVILEDFRILPPNTGNSPCEGNMGNQDNQLQGSQVILVPGCNITGPTSPCAGGPNVIYHGNVFNIITPTYDWSFTANSSGASFVGVTNDSVVTVNPGASAGSYTLRFIVTNPGPFPTADTCFITATVLGGPSLTCPHDTTAASCQSQAAIDAAYVAWLATASGGSTNNGGTAGPDKCGGTKTVTFTATNQCGTATCTASFTVTAPAPVVLTCPQNTTVAACQTQAAVNSAFATWLTTVSASGGCNVGGVTNDDGPAPPSCGGTKVVTFTYTSSCAPLTTTCTASFTVTAPAPVVLTCPQNTTVAPGLTQAQIDALYAAWLASASVSGGCNTELSNNSTGSPTCGETRTITFTVTSSCEANSTCTASFTVPPCGACTYTQGAYGNPGGLYCDGTSDSLTTAQLIAQSLANWGGTLTVGRPGRSVFMTAPAAVPCIISRLPGGGAAKELTVISNVNICSLPAAYLKNGRINNILLAQTITLGLNIGLTSPSILGNFVLQGGVLATAAPDGGCGSHDPKQRVCIYDSITHQLIDSINGYRYRFIDPAVVAAIVGPKTVQGLLNLADSALANADGVPGTENGVSLGAISLTVAAINEVFDGCRIFVGWDVPPCPPTNGPIGAPITGRMNQPVTMTATAPVKDLTAVAYPNPYTDRFRLRILSPVSGMAQIQFYDLSGQRVYIIRQFVQANVEQIVNYTGPTMSRILLFKVKVGDYNARGYALKPD